MSMGERIGDASSLRGISGLSSPKSDALLLTKDESDASLGMEDRESSSREEKMRSGMSMFVMEVGAMIDMKSHEAHGEELCSADDLLVGDVSSPGGLNASGGLVAGTEYSGMRMVRWRRMRTDLRELTLE